MGKIKEKFLIISPHSDDALFCCSHILLLPEYEVQVLTVENDSRRISEDKALFDFLNIDFHCLKTVFKDESYYGYNKLHPGGIVPEKVHEYLSEYLGTELMKAISEELLEWVLKFKTRNPDYKILAPWGIGHPFHYFVQNVLRSSFELGLENMYFYREFPHSYKRRSQFQVEYNKRHDWHLIRSIPVEDFADVKWKLASKFYRSQSGLLFFEQGYIKKNLPEEIWKYEEDDLPF